MKRAVLAVAILVVLSGCNAFGGGDESDGIDGPTVSPAPVPTPQETGPTATPGECLAPPPATPSNRTLPTPSEPAPLPGDDGRIDGDALVDAHVERLSNHRFTLRIDEGTTVWSMPNASAFAYDGLGLGFRSSHGYAVGGSLYTVDADDGQYRVHRQPYRLGSDRNERYVNALTGRSWLADRIGSLNYTAVGTRSWNGTEVRVLRDTVDGRLLLGLDEPYPGWVSIDSTVYVDRRGIVRYVEHVRDIQYEVRSGEYRNVTDVGTLRVEQLGSARVPRPDAFCVPDGRSAVLETPGPTAADGSSGERVPVSGPYTTDPSNGTRTDRGTQTGTDPLDTETESTDAATGSTDSGTESAATATGSPASG